MATTQHPSSAPPFSFGDEIVAPGQTRQLREQAFGNYLAMHSHLSTSALRALLEARMRDWQPLGALALKTRALSVKQVRSTLEFQSQHPNLPFGEIACTLGFLSPAEVNRLLVLQRDIVPSIEELLVRNALTTREEARALRIAFDDSERRDETLEVEKTT